MSRVDGPDDLPPRFRPHTSARDKSDAFLVNVKEYGIALALELADYLNGKHGRELTARRAGFELARLLIGSQFPGPRGLEEVVRPFATRLGFPLPPVWDRFRAVWENVENPVGDDTFDREVMRTLAIVDRATVAPAVGPAHTRNAVLAWLLQEATGGAAADFVFPTTRIAEAFGVYRSTVADSIKVLLARGVLVCTDPDYSFFHHKARKFRFVGSITIGGGS